MAQVVGALLAAAYMPAHAPRVGRTRHLYCSGDRVVACDLNGVLVDSQSEFTRSAWIAARELWPEEFEIASKVELTSKPWRAGARRAWAGGEWGPLQGL